jgi:hypothetical protein
MRPPVTMGGGEGGFSLDAPPLLLWGRDLVFALTGKILPNAPTLNLSFRRGIINDKYHESCLLCDVNRSSEHERDDTRMTKKTCLTIIDKL